MKPLEVIAFTIALLKAGYGVEKIIYELAQREEKGIFVKIVKAIKRGMELPEALERASNLEKGIMKEYFSMLAKVARGELGEIEPRLKEMLHYGYEEERRALRKSNIFPFGGRFNCFLHSSFDCLISKFFNFIPLGITITLFL